MTHLYKVSPELILTWRDGELIADNFMTRRAIAISKDTLTVLNACSAPIPLTDLRKVLTEEGFSVAEDEMSGVIESLVSSGLLIENSQEGRSCAYDNMSWGYWGPEAAYFHFATKDAPYIEATVDENEYINEIRMGDQPPIAKRYPNTIKLPLPHVYRDLSQGFYSVLVSRRTVREFKSEPVSIDDFSQLCDLVFAPKHFIDADAFGILPMRTYANAGARSELEVYTNILDVGGIDAGLYHYNSIEHTLEYLREPLSREDIHHLCYEQPMCDNAAAIFFISARLDRMGHKYRHPRALRAIYIDAGHLGQTFSMVATACGLGPWETAAYRDTEVENLLGLDGVSETVLYCLGIGIPSGDGRGPDAPPATLRAAANSNIFEDDLTFSQ
jgi:SagB-type dehydrogenase family enzyme